MTILVSAYAQGLYNDGCEKLGGVFEHNFAMLPKSIDESRTEGKSLLQICQRVHSLTNLHTKKRRMNGSILFSPSFNFQTFAFE